MKKQFILGMVTIFVAMPAWAQINSDANKHNPYRASSGATGTGFEYYLPFMEYQGFEMNPYYNRPKGFQGILILKTQNDKTPAWLKYEDKKDQNKQPKPDSSKKQQKPFL